MMKLIELHCRVRAVSPDRMVGRANTVSARQIRWIGARTFWSHLTSTLRRGPDR